MLRFVRMLAMEVYLTTYVSNNNPRRTFSLFYLGCSPYCFFPIAEKLILIVYAINNNVASIASIL